MGTKKPLAQLIPDILSHIVRYRDTLQFNLRLYKIDEGQLRSEVEESLRVEMLSGAALSRALQRIPSINILQKTADKLSKVYSEAPVRYTKNKVDRELMEAIAKNAELDQVMGAANRVYNVSRMAAIEPFVQDGKQRLRVLAGHQFLPFSDDTTNPLNMTVFIKCMGQRAKTITPVNNSDGTRVTMEDKSKLVDIFHLYSDDEFLVIDSDGSICIEDMQALGRADGRNPYGIIPYVYINRSRFELVPFPNKTALDISVLIPKLLTDLNYAAQFLSHSIIWTKNADIKGAEIHPDTVVNLGQTSDTGGDPAMGTVNPTVNIQEVLQLIEFQLSGYFSSIGIKGATVSSMLPGREASGFSKALDEGDVTAERKVQTEVFRIYEKQLWEKLAVLQDYWSRNDMVNERRKFSPKFIDNFSVEFGEMKHFTSQAEKLASVKTMRDLGLMTKAQALKEIYPTMSEDQLNDWISELEAETADGLQDGDPLPVGAQVDQMKADAAGQFNGAAKSEVDPQAGAQPSEDKTK